MEDPVGAGWNWYTYCSNKPIMFIDPSGLIGILPDGTIYMAKGDTYIDKQLLQYKIDYANAKTAAERQRITNAAQKLRDANPGKWHVSANNSLDYYRIYDYTDRLNYLMADAEDQYWVWAFGGILGEAAKYYKFYTLVGDNATYDLKYKPDWQHEHFIYNGEVIDKDAPGNILYGYLGRAMGFSEIILLAGACVGQIMAGTSSPEWFFTFFDDPRDQQKIKQGFRIYNATHFLGIRVRLPSAI